MLVTLSAKKSKWPPPRSQEAVLVTEGVYIFLSPQQGLAARVDTKIMHHVVVAFIDVG